MLIHNPGIDFTHAKKIVNNTVVILFALPTALSSTIQNIANANPQVFKSPGAVLVRLKTSRF